MEFWFLISLGNFLHSLLSSNSIFFCEIFDDGSSVLFQNRAQKNLHIGTHLVDEVICSSEHCAYIYLSLVDMFHDSHLMVIYCSL